MTTIPANITYKLREERAGSLPEDFVSFSAFNFTASEIDVQPWLNYIGRSVPVWEFRGYAMVVFAKKAVLVTITRGESLCFAENETLRIFTTGETREQAVEEFSRQLVYFFEYYKALDWDRVTGEAYRLKKVYEENFKGQNE